MESLLLKSFKAHKELEIKFDNKSFLLYGDNGAGKSSIYDALKIEFFEDKMFESSTGFYAPEQREEKLKEYKSIFNNRSSIEEDRNSNFTIFLEKDLTKEYQVFMLNLEDVAFDKYLNLKELLEKVYFKISYNGLNIQERSNELLKLFKEDITIFIDIEDNYNIRITDENRKLFKVKNIKHYFNEAKLNLVVFAILFSVIELSQDKNKKRVLILDDFITSLDMSNRTFLMKYILETFGEKFQIIILTHNVYFYNLIRYLIGEIYNTHEKWKIANLYEVDNTHKLYINPSKKKKLELTTLESDLINNSNMEDLGNKFRQKFEILLYEFSKILMVGGVEETNTILATLIKNKQAYFLKEGNNIKGSLELLSEIEKIIISQNGTLDKVKEVIDTYRVENFDEIKNILRDLKLFQKVQMHPLSHGQPSQSSFSIKEAEESLLLLKKLEDNIFTLMHKKVDGA